MAEIIKEPIENYALKSKQNAGTLFSKIGVVGCGIEGQNIVRIAALNGIEVVFIEFDKDKIETALAGIGLELDKSIEGWELTAGEKKAVMARIHGSLDYKDIADCDLVIETLPYNDVTGERSLVMRKQVFKNIEKVVKQDTIIATNATTIVIYDLTSELEYPERCISLHVLITSPTARIVEVAKGMYTTKEVYEKICAFVKLIKRQVIPVTESAGLVSMRLFAVLLNEACDALMEGVASMENIDKTMTVGIGMSLGVFRLADKIGLHKVVRMMENLYEEFGDPKYKPSQLIKRLVRMKLYGVQTGEGFYIYNEKGEPVTN